MKKEAQLNLTDGTGHKPHYSLRSLCRALAVAARNPCSSLPRSLLEAFCISFLTQLDRTSHQAVVNLIKQHVLGMDLQTKGKDRRNVKLSLDPIPAPSFEKCVQIEGYWIPQGLLEPQASDNVSCCYSNVNVEERGDFTLHFPPHISLPPHLPFCSIICFCQFYSFLPFIHSLFPSVCSEVNGSCLLILIAWKDGIGGLFT